MLDDIHPFRNMPNFIVKQMSFSVTSDKNVQIFISNHVITISKEKPDLRQDSVQILSKYFVHDSICKIIQKVLKNYQQFTPGL